MKVFGTLPDLLDDLAAGQPWRLEPMVKGADSLSGSPFQRCVVATSPASSATSYVVKHLSRDLDWVMRVLGDGAGGTRPRPLILWQDGVLDAMPPEIDPVVVGMAYDPATGLLHQVMHDVSTTMVPDGMVGLAQHRRFLDHLAALHVAFWGFADTAGLTTPQDRYGFASPAMTAREAAAGHDDPIPKLFPGGWAAVAEMAPEAAKVALALAADAGPLRAAQATAPHTLVHGDWKFGNLGSHPDGRTVLLDWAWPGEAPCVVDLGWYLGVNCDRLPESKEDTIAAYRAALERRGIATGPWWDRQLALALLGAFVQLGWSKTADPTELHWWTDQIVPTAQTL